MKLTTMDSEKKIETYLRLQVKKVGGYAYKFVSPNQRSVPDRLCLFPNGILAFVEVKKAGGKLSKGQELELKKIREFGFVATTVWSKKDVDYFIKSMERVRQTLSV